MVDWKKPESTCPRGAGEDCRPWQSFSLCAYGWPVVDSRVLGWHLHTTYSALSEEERLKNGERVFENKKWKSEAIEVLATKKKMAKSVARVFCGVIKKKGWAIKEALSGGKTNNQCSFLFVWLAAWKIIICSFFSFFISIDTLYFWIVSYLCVHVFNIKGPILC